MMEPKRDLPTTIQAAEADEEFDADGDTGSDADVEGDVEEDMHDATSTSPLPASASSAAAVSLPDLTPFGAAVDDAAANRASPAQVEAAPVRLGVIDYLNVVPVYDWLLAEERREGGTLGFATVAGVPSRMNQALHAGEVDVSNVSSVAFGRNAREWMLVPRLSVATHGEVQSVLLFSWHADWHGLDEGSIAVSSDSATSVALAKLLGEQRHSARTTYMTAAPDLDAMLAEHDAALLIGDIALVEGQARRALSGRTPYVFDLAAEWEEWTHLPFVFSVWAARADRADAIRASGVLKLLRESKAHGVCDLERLAGEAAERLSLSQAACLRYLRLLDYELSERDLLGLRTFLELAVPDFEWSDVRFIEE